MGRPCAAAGVARQIAHDDEHRLLTILIGTARLTGLGVWFRPLAPPVRALLYDGCVVLADRLPPRCRCWYLARAIGFAVFAGRTFVDCGQPDTTIDAFAGFLVGPPGPLHLVQPVQSVQPSSPARVDQWARTP